METERWGARIPRPSATALRRAAARRNRLRGRRPQRQRGRQARRREGGRRYCGFWVSGRWDRAGPRRRRVGRAATFFGAASMAVQRAVEHRARTGPPDAGAASVTGSDRGRSGSPPSACDRGRQRACGPKGAGSGVDALQQAGAWVLRAPRPRAGGKCLGGEGLADLDGRGPPHTRRRNLSGGRLFAQRSRSVSGHPSPAAASGAPASSTLGSPAARGMRSSPLAELHDQGRVPASAAPCRPRRAAGARNWTRVDHKHRAIDDDGIGLQPSSASDSTKCTRSGCREMECFR